MWVLHRPRTVAADKRANAAPAVLEFDAAGTFVQGWGGPADAYDWPDLEHGIVVDYQDKGNLYTAEVAPGGRVQRFVFKGLSSAGTQ